MARANPRNALRATELRLWLLGVAIAALVACLTLSLPKVAFAQGATGAINGAVTDPSGAAIPGAKVALRRVDTGTVETVVTNEVGRYAFPTVLPGRYTMTITKEGFTTTTESEFTLEVNQTSTHDLTLKVGAVTENVTVSAAATQVEATTSELGTAIAQTEINNLPLNGRNFTQLLSLTPGVSPIIISQSSSMSGGSFIGRAIGTFTNPSVNGQCSRCDLWLYDGLTNYAYVGEPAVNPILDSIQEFKVQSHNDVAAFGESIGGVINVVTRSGTSEYHGDAYEFVRNSAFDARNTFISTVTPYKQNQFGGVIGGPLLPGHFRSGASKTFFFAGYEGYRHVLASNSLQLIPTPTELTGDLSDISTPTSPVQIYNPFSTVPDPSKPGEYLRSPFMCDGSGNALPANASGIQAAGTPCNKIPSSMIAQNLVNYVKQIYPAPQVTGILGINYIDTTSERVREDNLTFRLDHQFTTNTTAWVRYSGFNMPQMEPSGLATESSPIYEHGYHIGAALTHTFAGGNKVLNVRFGRVSTQVNQTAQFSGGNALWTVGGFNPLFTTGFTGGIQFNPGQSIAGYTGIQDGHIQGNHIGDTWEWAGDLTWVRGHHTLQMGADFNTTRPTEPIQFVEDDYSSYNTANVESPAGTGNGLASFLLGVPEGFNRRNLVITTSTGLVSGYYFQDQWKATDKLQVNLGFRWDFTFRPIYSPIGGDTDMDTGQYILNAMPPACGAGVKGACLPGGVLPDHVIVTSLKNRQIVHNSYDNWQPRLGLTYRIRPNTVIRASASRFFENWAAINQLAGNYQGTWPDTTFTLANNENNPTSQHPTPYISYADPGQFGSGAAILPGPTPFTQANWFLDPYIQNPYSIAWNFGIEHQLTPNTLLEVDYVGSHGVRIDSGAQRNTAVVPGPGDITLRQPFGYITPTFFDKSIATSSYQGFQLKAEHRTSHGMSYLISYTWSKTMDEGCDGFFGHADEGCSVPNPYNLRDDWSVAGYNLGQNLSASWVYELPFGSQRRFSSQNHLVNYVFGNWLLNGIFTARSGTPFSIYASGDVANTGGQDQRALQIGPPYPAKRTREDFINASSFSDPTGYTFGNTGRNAFINPHVTNWDMSLFKVFPLPMSETTKLEFRVEAFNTFNQSPLNISKFGSYVSDPNFGHAYSTALIERQVQFAFKLYW
jgi:hypothetical protein